MQVRYVDEYGTGLYWGQTTQPIAPVIGDTVIIEEEEYRVKSRTFIPEKDIVVIEVTQNLSTSVKESKNNDSDRLNQMQRAILETNKRQDSIEKKTRAITEQVVTIRKHINQRIQQERKDNDTR